jgi:hypothetical protein
MTFNQMAYASDLVTPSGTGNSLFTLNASGKWRVVISHRIMALTTTGELMVRTSTSTSGPGNVIALGSCSNHDFNVTFEGYRPVGSAIAATMWQSSGAATGVDSAWTGVNYIHFQYLGQEE